MGAESRSGKSVPGQGPFLLSNFLAGDIQTGIMPLTSIDLLLGERWRSDQVGIVLAFGSLVLLLFQPLAGHLADRIVSKRAFFFLLSTSFAAGCLLLVGHPSLPRALLSQLFLGVAQGGMMPVLGSVAMGLAGAEGFPALTGWAQGASHAGSVFGAASVLLIALHGSFFEIFVFYALSSLLAGLVLFGVPGKAIDLRRAREEESGAEPIPVFRIVSLPFFIFLLVLLLFFVANTAMLPLAGDKLSGILLSEPPARVMAFLVLVTQALMIPFSLLAPALVRKVGSGGLLLSFGLLLLALRGGLLSETRSVAGILVGQFLDGTIMGLFSVLLPVLVAEYARGSGRFNLLQGLAGAVISAGASFSQLLSGVFLDPLGFDRTLLVLTGVALGGALFAIVAWRNGILDPFRRQK
jgi:MFS family permease